MRGKVKLGVTYETTIGDFTPISKEPGKLKYPKGTGINPWADPLQRLDGRYVDAQGRRLRRKYFIKQKEQ